MLCLKTWRLWHDVPTGAEEGLGAKSVCAYIWVCQLRVCAVRVVHRICPMYDAQLKHDMMEEGRQ